MGCKIAKFCEILSHSVRYGMYAKTPKYILEFMFTKVPSKMVQKWAKINVILFHLKITPFWTPKFINPYKDLEIKRS